MFKVRVSAQNPSVDDRKLRQELANDQSTGEPLGLRAAVSVMVASAAFLWGAAITLALAFV